ncbi:LPXTG cell wall anchor domain-containing protein [Staphylococcus simulans]|uniref:LPXTG cell wall anchor domain-containing protein n=1 Tax=Staphylococcus simulans TaxID=1286 RepID=UPI000D022B68|nr:LPXTG cell wall anchor domain-containing protein [Staphylococcus simulans]MCE5024990.1 LPXTG cell wall anchor domain-containing protein [Staphylococcus simulans]MEB6837281.1 LPXTG cell wall anchor domain-containing protein [Staphylococcus simulans]
MRKIGIFLTTLVAVALIFTGIEDIVKGAEAQAAKAVTGEVVSDELDPDGDGWANIGFENIKLDEPYQTKLVQLTHLKDTGKMSTTEYNEKVAALISEARSIDTSQSQELPAAGEAEINLVLVIFGLCISLIGMVTVMASRKRKSE